MSDERPGVVIENVTPEIDSGRFPAKSIVGQEVSVEADIFKDGHDILGACLKFKKKGDRSWSEVPMTSVDNDRWRAAFVPDQNARYLYTVDA